MENVTKPSNRRPSPPQSPPSPDQIAYLTKVKNLVFKAMGKHPTHDGHMTKVQYNQLIVAYFQQKLEPQEAAQRIIHKRQAGK